MSPKEVMGARLDSDRPDESAVLQRAARAYDALNGRVKSLEQRVEAVERAVDTVPQLAEDVAEVLLIAKNTKAVFRHITAKGIGLFIGGIITAAMTAVAAVRTTQGTEQEKTVVVKSATTIKLEACQGMAPSPAKDMCFQRLFDEQVGPK